MPQRKNVALECGHQREVGHQKVGDVLACSECGYAQRQITAVLPGTDDRPRWSDKMTGRP